MPRPSFSVVVPTRGRPHLVRRCLAALARLDFPRERFEVILVADGQSGNLPAESLELDGVRLRVLEEDQGFGPPRC